MWLPLTVAGIQNETVGNNRQNGHQLEEAVGGAGQGWDRKTLTRRFKLLGNFIVPEMGGGFMTPFYHSLKYTSMLHIYVCIF